MKKLQDKIEALEDALHALNNHFTGMQLVAENYLKPRGETGMKNRDVFIGAMLLHLDGPTQRQIQQQVQDLLQNVRVIDLEKESWKPIETAPKDGISILVMTNDQPGCPGGVADKCWCGNTAVAEWWAEENGGNGEWICYMNMVQDPELHFEPTHWMQLPEPPK